VIEIDQLGAHRGDYTGGDAMEDALDYPNWIREACRTVVRRALSEVAAHGLPEPHRFVVTFATSHPQSRLPAWLRAQYPQRMTVELQHQFWDLVVEEDGFGVELAFAGQRERIFVPFAAFESFADPSVELSFLFREGGDAIVGDSAAEESETEAAAADADDNVVHFDFRRGRTPEAG